MYAHNIYEDYAFGKKGEATALPILQTALQTDLKPEPPFSSFDFANGNHTVFCELKTRKCTHDRYGTLIVNESKVLTAKQGLEDNPDRRYIFAFQCLDGIWYIEYEPSLFETFHNEQRFNDDEGQRVQRVLHIPAELLHTFSIPLV